MSRPVTAIVVILLAVFLTYGGQEWAMRASVEQSLQMSMTLSHRGPDALGALPRYAPPLQPFFLAQATRSVLFAVLFYGLAIGLGINRSLSLWQIALYAGQLAVISPAVAVLGRAAEIPFASPVMQGNVPFAVTHLVANLCLAAGVILAAVWCFAVVPRIRSATQPSIFGSVSVVVIAALFS